MREMLTHKQAADLAGVDACDVRAALIDGCLSSLSRTSVEAWRAAGCPLPVIRGSEQQQAALARAAAMEPQDVLELQAERRRLTLELARLERQVASLTLELRRAQA